MSAASDWTSGTSSKDCPSYDQMIAGPAKDDFRSMPARDAALAGPTEVIGAQLREFHGPYGGFDAAGFQVGCSPPPAELARRSVELPEIKGPPMPAET